LPDATRLARRGIFVRLSAPADLISIKVRRGRPVYRGSTIDRSMEQAADMDARWIPTINRRRCTACGDCIATCPTEALDWMGGKAAVIRPHACTYCALCEEVCPSGAIQLPYQISFAGRDAPDDN